MFESLGWLNATQMANQATIQIVQKSLNNKSATAINNMFSWKPRGTGRNPTSHQASTISTIKRKGSNLLDNGRSLFNQLPLRLRNNSMKPSTFKRELKLYTLDNNQLLTH